MTRPFDFGNVPGELCNLRQWVLWRKMIVANRETKAPFSITGGMASVSDPSTWASFQEVLALAHAYDGIGFVLSESDPFTIIDLDNKPSSPCTEEQLARHKRIYTAFESYSELSVSETGAHIVVRGRVPKGVRRDNVEVYSSLRFMVFTGWALRKLPVFDRQDLLDQLYSEMQPAGDAEVLVQIDGTLDDGELVAMAMRASNAAKFNQLCAGEFSEYPSQSEADFALLSIIAFYTRDNAQVRRIFRMTALGKRDKAQRDDYLNTALGKIRAQQPPPIDTSVLISNAEKINAPKPEPVSVPDKFSLPPGLVGEVAAYFYQTAVRPVPEIALAAAIALAAGVAGRSFNISGSGLNHYLILLARTGTGKEGAMMGIENLITAVRPRLPMIDQFIGPAAFASGQALVKVLDEKPCFVSVLGEFGLTLQQLSDHRANSAQVMLRKVLLDLYAKSGWNRALRSSVYSDTEKNTQIIQAPNVTILGESTPETFFDGLDPSHVSEGLIPRFSIMEYKGPRPPRNRNSNVPPSAQLVQRFSDFCAVAVTTNNNNSVIQVAMDDHSLQLMDEFDARVDALMNASKAEVEMQIWNRAHLKALKLAALLATGINAHTPTITPDLAHWAIDFVSVECERVAARFRTGDVGQGDSKQFNELRRLVESYFAMPLKRLESYGVSTSMFRARVIPYGFLVRRTSGLGAFKNDKLGATAALRRCIQSLIDSGMLVEVPKAKLVQMCKYEGTAYGIGCHW